MTKKTTAQTLSFALERKILLCVGGIFLAVILLYTFLVMQSIAHVIEREEIVLKTNTLSEKVSRLEKNYLEQSQFVTEAHAADYGLYTAHHKVFIERGAYTLGTIR